MERWYVMQLYWLGTSRGIHRTTDFAYDALALSVGVTFAALTRKSQLNSDPKETLSVDCSVPVDSLMKKNQLSTN
jgi:hypothetical protein